MRTSRGFSEQEYRDVVALLLGMPDAIRMLWLIRDKPDAERMVQDLTIYANDSLLFGVNPDALAVMVDRLRASLGMEAAEWPPYKGICLGDGIVGAENRPREATE